MTTQTEALKMALEALENTSPLGFNMESDKRFYAAITAIKEALAQPEQEPAFWYSAQEDEFMTHKIRKEHERLNSYTHKVGKFDLPLYTHPSVPTAQPDCTRSHPHEEMSKECELRTEIARLTNCLKRANAQAEHLEREWYLRGDEIERLTAQLKEPEQKPVAWIKEGWGPDCGPYIEFYRDDEMGWRDRKEWMPLYTTPPKRKPLTDEQIVDTWADCPADHDDTINVLTLARAIEAAHGIKE